MRFHGLGQWLTYRALQLIGDGTAGIDGAGVSHTLTTLLALLSFGHSVRGEAAATGCPTGTADPEGCSNE